MKTKEIRERLRKNELLIVLETLNEQQLQTQRDLKELAHYFDKMVDTLNNVMVVADRMKSKIESFDHDKDDMNPSTNSLAVDNKVN